MHTQENTNNFFMHKACGTDGDTRHIRKKTTYRYTSIMISSYGMPRKFSCKYYLLKIHFFEK